MAADRRSIAYDHGRLCSPVRKFVALEPISKPDRKRNNCQRRIGVTRGGKNAASRDVKTIDLMDLAISVHDSLFRTIRHSGRPRRVSPVDKLGSPISVMKQLILAEMFERSGATQFQSN